MDRRRKFMLILISLIILLVFVRERVFLRTRIDGDIQSLSYIRTNKGNVSIFEIEQQVYVPFGYFITAKNCLQFLCLEKRLRSECSKVFRDWLTIAMEFNSSNPPLTNIPTNLVNDFTLNEYSHFIKSYMNSAKQNNQANFFAKIDVDKAIESEPAAVGYPTTGGYSVYYAMAKHRLDGLTGLVIGSLSPWVEAICLRNGARKVITVDYRKIETDDSRLGYMHPIEMAQSYSETKPKFDFAVSFSSIEHSGLGRYGDPIDPFGDIREMEKVACLLKKGGLFFVGLPVGADVIVYNLHRVYGPIRLPIMFAGWKLLNIFFSSPNGVNISGEILSIKTGSFNYHHTFVLEKV